VLTRPRPPRPVRGAPLRRRVAPRCSPYPRPALRRCTRPEHAEEGRALMDPITGAPDNSDRLRMMTAWLLGSPPGNAAGYVQGEMQSQQAVTDQARHDKVRDMVHASYPGVAQGTVQSSATPSLPAWRVTAEIPPGPVQRMPRGE